MVMSVLDLVSLIVWFVIWLSMLPLPCSVLYQNLVIVLLDMITLQHKFRKDPRASLFPNPQNIQHLKEERVELSYSFDSNIL